VLGVLGMCPVIMPLKYFMRNLTIFKDTLFVHRLHSYLSYYFQNVMLLFPEIVCVIVEHCVCYNLGTNLHILVTINLVFNALPFCPVIEFRFSSVAQLAAPFLFTPHKFACLPYFIVDNREVESHRYGGL